jgi:hypothetical protein
VAETCTRRIVRAGRAHNGGETFALMWGDEPTVRDIDNLVG